MPRFPLHAASTALLAALALGAAAPAEPTRVPGTGVRLTPPPGFAPAEQFAGFQNPERNASIVVTEIPGPVSEVRRGMTRSGLASRGVELIESSRVTVGGKEALLLHVSQRSLGTDYFKWMLVGGSEARTFMVVGTFPAEESDLSDPVRQSLLSASWGEDPRADLFEGMPFRVESAPRLKLADRMGNLLIFTETGRIAPGKPDMAVLIIGSSMGDVAIGDLEGFSKDRLLRTDRMTGVRVRSGASISVDSLPGYELIAEGADAKNGRPVGVYQLMLADGKSYYIAQGFVAKTRLNQFLPVFRQVTGTFQRTSQEPTEESRPTITQ